MIITIDSNFYASPSTRLLGNYGEAKSRSIAVCFPQVDGASLYKLRFLLPDGVSCFDADVTLGSMIVEGCLLSQVGKLSCQWIATGINESGEYTVVAKSNVFSLLVGESINSDLAEPVPTYEQAAEMFDRVVELAENLEDTTEDIADFLVELEESYALSTAPAIVSSAMGESVVATDSTERSLHGLTVYGKSTQNGTPTLEAPVDIVSVKNPTVKVNGKNLLNTSGTTQTKNGVTFTFNADKSITIEGTATAITTVTMNNNLPTLPIGTMVTLKPNGNIAGCYIQINYKDTDGKEYSFLNISETDVAKSKAIPIDFSHISSFFVGVRQGSTVNTTIRPQLEIGTIATAYEPYKPSQTLTVSGTFRGLPVASDGNYTDSSGRQWICDEIDLARGVVVRHLDVIRSYNGESVKAPFVSTTGELSQGATVVYVRETPIETALTEAELTSYKSLKTNFPCSTITNDKNAGLKAMYVADTKTYVDNQFKMLFALLSSN